MRPGQARMYMCTFYAHGVVDARLNERQSRRRTGDESAWP